MVLFWMEGLAANFGQPCHALVLVMLEGVPNARAFVGRRCPALPNYFMGP